MRSTKDGRQSWIIGWNSGRSFIGKSQTRFIQKRLAANLKLYQQVKLSQHQYHNITHSLDSWLLIQPARSPVQATKCPRHSSALSFTWRDSTFQKSRSRVFLWKRCGRCGLLINVSGKKLCFEHLRACKVQPAENEVASCKCYVSIPSLWPKPRRQVSSPWAQRQFAQELASKRETLVPRHCNPKHCSTGVPFGLSNPSA